MATRTTANMPNPGTPLVGPDGRLTQEWFAFFVALLSRTGGEGTPIDTGSLANQLAEQGAEIGDLFALENAVAPAALIGALAARIAVIEMAMQDTVTPVVRAAPALPDPVAVRLRCATTLPEPVPVAMRMPDDIRKLIEA